MVIIISSLMCQAMAWAIGTQIITHYHINTLS